jgi:hypothetical protein
VPRTTTLGKYNERQKRKAEAEAKAAAESSAQGGISNETSAGASQNGPHTNGHQGFTGPSGHHRGQRSIDLLEDTDAMDVDRDSQASRQPPQHVPHMYQPMPSTAHMLEKARAASQRADAGPSPTSYTNPHQPPPPPSADA